MKFSINEQIQDKYAQFSLGIIVGKDVDNIRKNSAMQQLFSGLSAQLQNQMKGKNPGEMPFLDVWHRVFEDMEQKSYLTNLEALLKKVLRNKPIPFTDNITRLRDYCMLKWRVPIMCFSLDEIYGDLFLESDNGKVVYRDNGNILSKRWNSEQVDRGSVHDLSKNVIMIIENMGVMNPDELQDKTHELAQMLNKYAPGREFEEAVLISPFTEKDLGVAGMTTFHGQGDVSKFEAPAPEQPEEIDAQADEIQEEAGQEDDKEDKKPLVTLKEKLGQLILDAVKKTYTDTDIQEVRVEYPREKEHGDYACNIAMQLAKKLEKNPLEIAQEIIENLEKVQFIDEMQAVKPGFINIKLDKKWLGNRVNEIAEQKECKEIQYGQGKTIVIDYSSPNIAKPLGVHHLLSTIIGQTVYNIYKKLGYNCVGVNHLGDWGTQFGKLIYAYKNWGDKKTIDADPIAQLLKLYVKFHDEAEKDSTLDDKARAEFKKIEDGDAENLETWEWFKQVSMDDLRKTYETLGVHFDEYIGESFFNDKMEEIIKDGLLKTVIKKGEGGALVVEFEDEKYPTCLVQKSDGATLYITRDLAALKYRLQTWKPEKLLYVVDMSQSLHFKQLFDVAERMGMDDAEMVHISFGRMHLPDKSMSTRKGNVVLLEDLLQQGVQKAEEIVKEKNKDLDVLDQKKNAEMIAIGAIKYNILSQNRNTDITFIWENMLNTEGNSAPYMQYSVARANSILKKYEEMIRKGGSEKEIKPDVYEEGLNEEEKGQTDIIGAINEVDGVHEDSKPFDHEKEQAVARSLVKYQEYLIMAAQEYKPNILAQYLYNLAQDFNSFYNSVSVLNAGNKEVRLARINLTKAVAQVLTCGLEILGIDIPERM